MGPNIDMINQYQNKLYYYEQANHKNNSWVVER